MADAKKQDRWLDVKDAMAVRSITLGAQAATALADDPDSLILQLSFYKLAAKVIGPQKRVIVYRCGEGIGTWVMAKECGFSLGVDDDEAALTSARANFADERTAFATKNSPLPAGPWHAVVEYLADGVKPTVAAAEIAPQLTHDGVLVLGAQQAPAARELRKQFETRFHHVFAFEETLGIVPGEGGGRVLVVVGCRPRR